MNNLIIKILILILCISFVPISLQLEAKTKNKTIKKSSSKTPNSKEKKKKKKSKRRRVKFVPSVKMVYPQNYEVIKDSNLIEGVNYKKIAWGKKYKHYFHVVQLDINSKTSGISILKAGEFVNELEKLQEIIRNYDSKNAYKILAATNANFWRAYYNTPIGPTIVNGEVVELRSHKEWSSGLFDENDHLYIDNFHLSGWVLNKRTKNKTFISNVNSRNDSIGMVYYNKFSGNSIPYISNIKLDTELNEALEEAALEAEFIDSTDTQLDTAKIKDEIIAFRHNKSVDYSHYKAAIRYIDIPGINKDIKCLVEKLDTGLMKMPDYGCIISFGKEDYPSAYPKVGDTLIIRFETNTYKNVAFFNGVSGTPRLVREGKANHEAMYEGSHGKRFMNMQLPRTAIGTNEQKDIFYLVVVESSALSVKKAGATLQQLAGIMKKIGCYDAMNLDGGGSSLMVIDGKNILFPNRPEISRRISVGIGVIKKVK